MRRAVAGAVALASLLLAGCAVRLETPPPPPPSPGPIEQVRQAHALAAQSLAADALALAETPVEESVTRVLQRVADESLAHLDALGGVYVPDGEPETEAVEPDEDDVAVSAADLTEALVAAAQHAHRDMAALDDAALAQLLASIATARLLAADSLAGVAELDGPALPAGEVPETVPADVASDALEAVVLAEDQAGYLYRIVAARSQDSERSRAWESSLRHAARGEAWLRLAGLDAPGLDPRRTDYPIGGSLDDAAFRNELLAGVQLTLAQNYAALIARTAPADRQPLADLLTTAAAAQREHGSAPGALPGLP